MGTFTIDPVNKTVDIDNEPGEHLIRKMPENSTSSYQPENCAAKGNNFKLLRST